MSAEKPTPTVASSERSKPLLDVLPRVLLNLGARVRLNFGARGSLVSSGYRGPWYTPGRLRDSSAKPGAVAADPVPAPHPDWRLSEEVAEDYREELTRRRILTRR